MSFLPQFVVLSKSTRDDIKCKCGLWIKTMPGYLITGDEDCGILYLWLASSGDVVDRMSVHDFGIVSMTEISDFTIALVFKDGLVGIFDFNLVSSVFSGARTVGSVIVYTIIAVAALWLILSPFITGGVLWLKNRRSAN